MIDYKNKIKVIGLDLDQTLYPKSPKIDEAIQGYIYEKISIHRDCDLEEAEKLFKDLYKDGSGLSGTSTLKELGIPCAEDIVQEALENADIAEFLAPDKEILDFLNKLKEQYMHIDLITGSNKENAFQKMEHLNIPKEVFSNIITGETASKSDGGAFELWMSYYKNTLPEEFLYIGDRPSSDHFAPKKLCIHSILVNVPKEKADIECLQLSSLKDLGEYLL
jgi:FMN phosphatase YigB (HAD superfamily)